MTENTLDFETIRDHYGAALDIYSELAAIEGARTAGFGGNSGWYRSSPITDDMQLLEEGFKHKARAKSLTAGISEIVQGNTDARAAYALTTYSSALDEAEPYQWGQDSRVWHSGENPLPDYHEIDGMALFADVDLIDEKKRRPLPAREREIVEEALTEYVTEFADLAGGLDHVYLLDSVGGAYPMIPATSTAPIADQFEEEDRARIYQELGDRMNDWLQEVWNSISSDVDGAEGLLDPDHVNHKNRQYKVPLSLHADIDGVVAPIDVQDVSYEFTPIEEADEDLITRGLKWAEGVTAERHREAINSIVERLWPVHSEQADDWAETLERWLFELEAEKHRQERRREQLRNSQGDATNADVDLEVGEVRITTHQSEVEKAVSQLDAESVIEDTILGDGWTDSLKQAEKDRSGKDKRAFVPTWATTYDSGNATFVVTSGSNEGVWYDSSDNNKGGLVEAALISETDYQSSDGFATGDNYGAGLQALRNLGYDIPVFIPDADSVDGDRMPLWALRKFALRFGVVEEDSFVERESDDGSVYLGFENRRDYQRTVRRAEAAGLNTGRTDHLDEGFSSAYYDAELREYTEGDADPYADPDVMLTACLRARHDGEVPKGAEPPTMALLPIVRDITGRDSPDMRPGTRELAMEVYHEDLTVEDVEADDEVEIA